MRTLPDTVAAILNAPGHGFTKPSFTRFLGLAVAALVTRAPCWITALVCLGGLLASGHVTTWHRLFNRPGRKQRWSSEALARFLAQQVLELVPQEVDVTLAVDDTSTSRPGDRVYGKGCHRDAVASSQARVAFAWGHKWVVLCVVVEQPFASRPWALPVLVALFRDAKTDKAEGRRHRTVLDLARQMTKQLRHWFPHRRFVLAADGGFASVEMAAMALTSKGRVHLVSKMKSNTRLFAQPVRTPGKSGRPRVRGESLPSPKTALVKKRRARVRWYGGGTRRVTLRSGVGCMYRSGLLVPIRWVHVVDREGSHREEWLFSTDVHAEPADIVSTFTKRWNIETTFQELRAHHRLETTRVWSRNAVLSFIPCIFLLYTVAVLARRAQSEKPVRPLRTPWYSKAAATYSDLLAELRSTYWRQLIAEQPVNAPLCKNHPTMLLLEGICRAA
jgi:hypothetical protein